MNIRGYHDPLYILPFDHRGSFETGMFGWKGLLTAEQTAQITAAKQVIYDGFQKAIARGAPKGKSGILVDEQFGTAILRDAARRASLSRVQLKRADKTSLNLNTAKSLPRTSRPSIRRSAKYWSATTPREIRR